MSGMRDAARRIFRVDPTGLRAWTVWATVFLGLLLISQ